MKYKKLTGVILKKQNYREADQIVSCWTREAGKIRFLAKSLRRPGSKLNYAVQDLSEVELDLAGGPASTRLSSLGGHLPTLIGAKPLRQFNNLHQDLKKTAIVFYGAELMLKMTADEHPNQQAFDLLLDFLSCLDKNQGLEHDQLLDGFCVNLLEALGFKIPDNLNPLNHSKINYFIEYILERNIKSESLLVSLNN